MSETQFVDMWLRVIERTRKDGNEAEVTMDGGGPQRLVRFLEERWDPRQYTIQVSVRNNRGALANTWPVQYARAYMHLVRELPWASVPTIAPTLPITDQSVAYDSVGGAWTSTFMCLSPDCPNLGSVIKMLTTHFRQYAYTDPKYAPWQVFSSTTSFHDKVCYEYNVPARRRRGAGARARKVRLFGQTHVPGLDPVLQRSLVPRSVGERILHQLRRTCGAQRGMGPACTAQRDQRGLRLCAALVNFRFLCFLSSAPGLRESIPGDA